jgi:hypothetical protein
MSENKMDACQHTNVVYDHGTVKICTDCGTELNEAVCLNKVYFSAKMDINRNSDSNYSQDPILAELQAIIPENPELLDQAMNMFVDLTDNKVYRGLIKKSMVIACMYHIIKNKIKSGDNKWLDFYNRVMNKITSMEKKSMIEGMKNVSLKLVKNIKYYMDLQSYVNPLSVVSQFRCCYLKINESSVCEICSKNKATYVRKIEPQSKIILATCCSECAAENQESDTDSKKYISMLDYITSQEMVLPTNTYSTGLNITEHIAYAPALLYNQMKDIITMKSMAELSGITQATLNKIYKSLKFT